MYFSEIAVHKEIQGDRTYIAKYYSPKISVYPPIRDLNLDVAVHKEIQGDRTYNWSGSIR